MNVELLRQARYREPFEPFSLRLRDGREVPVHAWTAIAIAPKQVIVLGKGGGWTVAAMDQIESIIYSASAK